MKVKVGNKIYDSRKEPVMVILTEQDKENIKNMLPTATKYCMYPIVPKWIDNDNEGIKQWMNEK